MSRAFYSLALLPFLSLCLAAQSPIALTRGAVLKLLDECGTSRELTLSGQSIGHANGMPQAGYRDFVVALAKSTDSVPAIASLDYGYNEIPTFLNVGNRPLVAHWQAGGLVMVSMHPANPWTRDDVHDLDQGDFEDLFRPGTAVHSVWVAQLERVARGLMELQESGVIVLFRPFHEMNGGWFWWGPRQKGRWWSQQRFERLWRTTYEFLVTEKQLENLLWVYSPAARVDREKPVLHYYPGNDVVDVVALDWYSDQPDWSEIRDDYEQLAKTGKPVGIAEFGPLNLRHGDFDNRKLLELLEASPNAWAFFSYWHSWDGAKVALVDHQNATALMEDHRVLNRRQSAAALSRLSEVGAQSSP